VTAPITQAAAYPANVRSQAALDAVVLLAFAAVGRYSHGESLAGTLVVAAPFLIGWFAAAALLRLGRKPASGSRAFAVWVVALPVGLALRRGLFDRGIAVGFVIVAAVFTLVFLVGRRYAASALRGGRRRSMRVDA
jgi:hypothetical protein